MNISFKTGQRYFFLGVLGAVTLFFLWMIRDFLFPVFWAVVFAVLLYPLHLRLIQLIRNETLAALVAMLAALVLIIIPVSWLATNVAQEAYGLYRASAGIDPLSSMTLPPPLLDSLESFGINREEISSDVASWARAASSWVVSQALAISTATFGVVLKTLFMLYLLFFFLRDGKRLALYVMERIPLGDAREMALFQRFADTTRATLKGTVLSAAAQGFVGAVIFFVAGIPNVALWGAVMTIMAVIPAIGPSIIWIPAGIILFATGNMTGAIIVIAGGIVLVSPIDNILKPILVGREIKMPDALILVSILGGIAAFGMAGIIVGPVAAALTLAVWDMFKEEYKAELSAEG